VQPARARILTINGGSSSIKFALFEADQSLRRILAGSVERIGLPDADLVVSGVSNVEDFIIDDETWAIRYLVVDTQNSLPGKKVLVSPQWIERVSWSETKVFVNLSRDTIKQAPEYTEESLLDRDYETRLHEHYKRQGYWVDVGTPGEQSH
jgi:hypothetical protein